MVKKRRYGRKKSKPQGAKRNQLKGIDRRYAHAREDAQIAGRVPTTPEMALKPEKVDPSSQSEQRFPGLIGQALRNGWAVPDGRKPALVDEMISLVEDPEAGAVPKVMAFNALAKGDQIQHERDQEFIRLDRVLQMWQGVLEAVRSHITDPELLKAITEDVLRLMPVPSRELVYVGPSSNGHPAGQAS